MGGRGSSSGIAQSGILDKHAPIRTIESIYREARGWSSAYYKDSILEAVDGKNGELVLDYARPKSREKEAKTNRTQYLTYKLKSGAVNGDVFGVNWDNVKSVSGQTYNLKQELKNRGFRWDSNLKKWIRK